MNVFTIHYADNAELERKLMAILSSVKKWQKVGEVARQYGVESTAMTNRLKRWKGGPFPHERGASGRILRLQVTPELHVYFEGLRGRGNG